MPRKEVFEIRPAGWHNSEDEWFRLSLLDLIITQHYNNYALIFKLKQDSDKTAIPDTFRHALESTLGQCRHAVGTIESNEHGDFSIVKRHCSTVPLVVQWFDDPEDQHPSFSDLERVYFCSGELGDPTCLVNTEMTMTDEASPKTSPAVAGFQLNFIPGGLIFTANIHHFAMDVTGACGLIRQLAAHCYSLQHKTPPPTWDERLMDRSRFMPPPVPKEARVDPQPSAPRHHRWLPCSWLLFHISQSKLYELKQLATPDDGSWVSTYDALSAYLWRVLSKTRASIYKPDLHSPAIFLESVNMRKRCKRAAFS